MLIPFLDGAYTGRSPSTAPQECVNLFYERGVDSESLVSTPGDTVFNSAYTGEVRGAVEYADHAFFVIGNTLYEVDSVGVGVSRGTLSTTVGRVSMAAGLDSSAATSQEICIVDGTSNRYIYDHVAKTLTAYASGGDVVVFFDGYFVWNIPNTDSFSISTLYDGTTVDSTFNATGDPDNIVSLVAEQRQLFVIGEHTTSAWYNSGDADSIFERFQGGYTQTGGSAAASAVRFDNSVVWLSKNERGQAQVVRLAEGFQPTIISTPEVSYQISRYAKVSDAIGYAYQAEGHEFYVLTFPTAKATWAYDASTQKWHRRAHTIDGVFPNRERYNCHVFAFGKHLMGDVSNGNIYELDIDSGTANGVRIPRVRTSAIVSDEEKRLRFMSIQLDMEEGVGGDAETSVYLSYSKDGGHTYSNEIERSMGDIGEYARRVIWRRLGIARNWVFRIRTFSPNRIIIKGLIGRISVSLFSFRENPGIQRYPKNEMQWKHWINEVAKWIAGQAEVDAATAAAAAATASALLGQVWGEDVGADFRTDPGGLWPPDDPSKDVVVQFFGAGLTVSPTTRTIRVTLTSATGLVTLTDQGGAGDATTVVITHASPSTDGKAVVTHTASGAIGKATGQAVNNSTAGGSPGK